MTEIQNPHFFKGHKFDLEYIRLDLYRLLCYFESSRSLAEIEANTPSNDQHYFESLAREFFEDEVGRILLQTAIVLRVIDDESEADPEERDPFYCGKLDAKDKNTDLSLRQACNKIIHAQKINLDEECLESDIPESKTRYKISYVYLYGWDNKKRWRATVDMRVFLNYGARILTARTLQDHVEWNEKYGRT